jgi:hypothetical protein
MKPVEMVLRRGEGGRRKMIEEVNPTKIYFKHIWKYHNVFPIQLLHDNKIKI